MANSTRNAKSHLVSENLTFSQQFEKQNISIAYDFYINKTHESCRTALSTWSSFTTLTHSKKQLTNLMSNS